MTEISYKIMRHKLELKIYFQMWNGYPLVREAMFVVPMEKGPDFPRPAYDARYPVTVPPRGRPRAPQKIVPHN